jgi:hypothetical protein
MKLTVTRLDGHGRYETLIARDDGVRFYVKGVGHNFAIPHDIAHFVVENALHLNADSGAASPTGQYFPQ